LGLNEKLGSKRRENDLELEIQKVMSRIDDTEAALMGHTVVNSPQSYQPSSPNPYQHYNSVNNSNFITSAAIFQN